jgi:hypothetical protein
LLTLIPNGISQLMGRWAIFRLAGLEVPDLQSLYAAAISHTAGNGVDNSWMLPNFPPFFLTKAFLQIFQGF